MGNSGEPGAAFAEQGGAPRVGRPVGQNLARFLRAHPDWGFGAFLLLFGIVFQMVMLFAEVAVDAPPLNDHVLHLLNVRRTAEAILTGADPTDPWLGQVALGYPLFHHYQHLPYLLPGALVALTRGALRAEIALRWVTYLLLCLFPLALYWSGRRLGMDRLAALFAGVAGPFIATNGLYGLDFVSYVWSGYGMYTQLWGMWLFALGLGQGYYTLRTGRGYLASVILVSAALLSHVVYAYMLLGSLGLAAILLAFLHPAKGEKWPSRLTGLKRFALLVGLMALVSAYFLVPFFRDRAYLNRSVWEYPWKYDSFGLPWVITTLFKGQLFDAGRFPSLTLLVLLGAVICFVRWQGERDRFLLILFVFWLLLYAGRPTWGALINLLPLSRDLHLHRLIGGVHLGGIYLMGVGLAWLWEATRRLRSREQRFLVPALLTLALLIPVYRERYRYLWQNAFSMVETANAVAAERQDLDRLFQALRGLPPGRVYAGLPARWGKDIRVGAVPLYALLSGADFDTVGYLYHALSLNADIMVLFEDGRFEQYDLFNVRYVITPQDWTVPSYYHVLGDFGRFRLYGVETSGYFDLVSANAAFVGTREGFYPAASAWLGSPLVAAKDHPLLYLEKAPSEYAVRPLAEAPQIIPWMPVVEQAVPGRILWQAVSSDTYEASVSVEQACFLMLKVTYHPNWRAYVDGARAEKVMLMPSYLGVRLTPGEHTVRFEYRSGALRPLLGVLGLLILALVGWAERNPGRWATLYKKLHDKRFLSRFHGRPFHLIKRVNRDSHVLYLACVLGMVVLASLPLLQMQMMSGHDAPEYITRTVEFYHELRAGHLFPRWAPDLNFGYGEPFFNFNPPLIYYLMSLFRALGTRFVAAQNLACLALLCAAGLGMYLLVGGVWGKRSGLVAATAYLFAPYMLVALYVRQALADFSAFAPLPYAFWGVYQVARGKRYGWVVGSLAVFFLMLSSNPVALMSIPLLVLWAAWLGWKKKSRGLFLRGAMAILLGLSLAAFFWIPALAERDLVQTANLFKGYLNYRNHFVYPSQFMSLSWGYGLSLAGPGDKMSFGIGPLHLLALIGAFLLLWKGRQKEAPEQVWLTFFLVAMVGSLFFASTLSQPVWDWFHLLQYLEFPWRFLTLVAFTSAVLCGIVFHRWRDVIPLSDAQWSQIALPAVLILFLLWGVPKARPERYIELDESHHSPQAIAAWGIGVTTAGEYTPIWVHERPQSLAESPLVFVAGKGHILFSEVSSLSKRFRLEIQEDARLRLNTFYFPGWTLYVNDVEHLIEYENPQGVMEFTLPAGHYEVWFVFRDTPVRRWSKYLSIAAFGVLLLGAMFWHRPRVSATLHLDQDLLSKGVTAPPLPFSKGADRSSRATAKKQSISIGIYLFLLSIYLISSAGHFFTTDHIATYLTAKSLVERHELALEKPINDAALGRDGKYYTGLGLGQSLAVIPLYVLGTWVDRLASPEVRRYFAGVDLGDWGGTVPIFFVSLLNQFLTPLIAVIVYRFGVRLGLSHSRSLGVALVYGLGTAAWAYARDSFQHPLETLLLLLTLYILYTHKGDRRLTWVFLAGCAFAGGVLTRVNLLLVYPVVGAYLLYLFSMPAETPAEVFQDGTLLEGRWAGLKNAVGRFWERVRRGGGLVALLSFSLPIALALGLDFYINFYRFGNIFSFHPRAQAAGLSTPLWYGLYGNLFSLGRSIFLYSPPIVLTFWAAKSFYREHRAEALLFGGIIAIYLLGYSLYGFWSGGWSWGPRFLVATLPYWVLPLGGFTTTRWRRILLGAAVLMGMFIQILGVAVNYSYVHWEWIRMNASGGEIYLFVPSISPVAMHWRSLTTGRNIDLWLLYVFKAFGPKVFALTLGLLLALLVGGLYELGALQGAQRVALWLRKAFERVLAPSDAG